MQDEDFGHASFMARMAQGFASGARMIALLSHAYQQSEYCKKEYEHVLADDPRNLHERLIVLRVEEVAPVEHLKELAYTDLVPLLSDASEVARVVRVAIGLEKRPSEIDFASLYRRAPKILHPEVEAVPGFIGRERELDALDAALRVTDSNGAPTAALTDTTATAVMGLGGVGKTLLAKHYAWQHREHYQGIWWLRAERRETVIEDLIALGARLIPGLADWSDREAAVQAVLDHLAHTGSQEGRAPTPWLLIYDNVEGPDDIQHLTPREGACILITSRWSDWQDYAKELPIDAFPPETAVQFLLVRSRDKDREGASRMAEDLGYLPLALEHARTYCWRSHCSFEQYRVRLPELIKKTPAKARYPRAVFATFDIALTKATEGSPEAESLMELLAFFAPDSIPLDLVAAALPDESVRDAAVSALADVSLVTFGRLEDGSPAISVHRLVQEVARTRMGEKRQTVISQSLDLMLAQWPPGNDGGEPKYWPLCSRLLAHALALLGRAGDHEPDPEKSSLLLSSVAFYLNSVGRYEEAEPLFRQALEIRQRVLGEEHPSTAASYNNVAYNLDAQGRYEEAEPLYRQALEIWKATLPSAHPHIEMVQTALQELHARIGVCAGYV